MKNATLAVILAAFLLAAVGLVWLLLPEEPKEAAQSARSGVPAALSARLAEIERRLSRLEARSGLLPAPAAGGSTAAAPATAAGAPPASPAPSRETPGTAAAPVSPPRTVEEVSAELSSVRRELEQLKTVGKRGAEVLDRVEAAEQAAKKQQEQLAALRDQFTKRYELDRERYGPDELKRLEDLYQKGSREWGTQESIDSFRQVLERYPDSNRAGCSAVFIAEQLAAAGNLLEAERYFTRARDQWGDSLFGDGVQVGAMSRARLAEMYARQGRIVEARQMAEEALARYPAGVDHSGRPLRQRLEELLANLK